jgi:DNA-binding transcriptional LysR family regulator
LPNAESTTRVAVVEAFLRQGLTPPVPIVEAPSFFYSLSLVAQTDLLTCCAHSAALLSSNQATVLPVKMGLESTPVSLVWRQDSAEACRAVAHLSPVIDGILAKAAL